MKSQMPQVFRPFLLEHVAPAGVGERDGRPAPVGPAADEREGADAVDADQRLAEARPHPDSSVTGRPARRMRAWARVRVWKPPWLGVLATTALPASDLHQLGVDLHAHRIVPAGDVGHRPGQRLALPSVRRLELALDLPQVPAHAVDAAVDVGAGQPPRLADLPHEQQGEQVAVLAQRVDRRGDPEPALVEVDLGPVLVLGAGELHRGHRLVVGRPAAARGSGVPSTGLTWSPGIPIRRHSPRVRLRSRSESNASGAAWTQRPIGLPPRRPRLQHQWHELTLLTRGPDSDRGRCATVSMSGTRTLAGWPGRARAD